MEEGTNFAGFRFNCRRHHDTLAWGRLVPGSVRPAVRSRRGPSYAVRRHVVTGVVSSVVEFFVCHAVICTLQPRQVRYSQSLVTVARFLLGILLQLIYRAYF